MIIEIILFFKSVILSPSVVSAAVPLQEEGLVTTHPQSGTGATADPGAQQSSVHMSSAIFSTLTDPCALV